MSVPTRAAARALPVFRPGLSRRGANTAAQRCFGASMPLSRQALGAAYQRNASSSGSVARRGLCAGGLRWYSSSTYGSSSDETGSSVGDSGESLASSVDSLTGGVPRFAFAFDIDGVLLHSSEPIPGATETLRYLQQQKIPFILLTNGGGKLESERVAELSEKLGVELGVSNFVQSHTPYQRLLNPDIHLGYPDLQSYLERSIGRPRLSSSDTVLVLGSDASKARHIAYNYGFESVVTPADILKANPEVFPFDPLKEFYAKQETLPLPRPIYDPKASPAMELEDCLKIDAIMVFNDPRDWAVDIQLIKDLLLSHRGYLGTYSPANGDPRLPRRRQWQADGQPALIFSNADLLWSTGYHLPRLGQGAFRAALQHIWNRLVRSSGAKESRLREFTFGKPALPTYWHAWDVLQRYHREQFPGASGPLRRVHMVGDNPESDIRGVTAWNHCTMTRSDDIRARWPMPPWSSYLVRTGVWAEDKVPLDQLDAEARPHWVRDDVRDAVNLALDQEGWAGRVE
ncbi:hypothetical protein VSDG_07925 [Cytospora chrysosperma]|uniref:HAD-superfamily subfamily IIA hydrolase n=1 Tax=Cytospora chrysosperma TaxID=252740 RepID=A0A423VKU6_CYTCH|nr:hypothetical protein VSDG_07925 [Valsa sordida]